MSTPSLLNIPYLYKAGTLYSQIPESGAGDFTVQRTTTVANRSTRINKDGLIELVADNVPRLDYPLGGAVNGCPALLVEPSATNLFQRSEEFNNAYWTPSNVTPTPNSTGTLDPFGGNNAELITKTSAVNTVAGISRSAPFSATGTHTLSVFIKSSVGNSVLLRMDSVNNTANTAFTFSTKTFSNSGANFISSSFQEFSNGWFRLSLTASVQSTLWNVDVVQLFSNPTNDAFWIFGAQLEANSVPTSYIPTTTAAVTRSADIVRKTGITSLIGQSEGTVYFEVEVTAEARNKWFFTLDSASNSFIQAWINSGRQINIQIQNNASIVMTLTSSALSVGYHKVAFAYNTATNGCEMFIDGVRNPASSATVTGAGLPAFNNFTFGSYLSTQSDTLKGHVRAGELHPNRLSNAQLATLTAL